MTSPADLLASELRRDGARPLVTFYDDATDERVELSVATTANWVAKAANLFADVLDVAPGDTVCVLGPAHWQPMVMALAAWEAGAEVGTDIAAASAAVVTEADAGRAQAALGADGVVVMALAPMGVDLARLLASQPDRFVPVSPAGGSLAATAADNVPEGARVLTTVPVVEPAGRDLGLLGPLARRGSVVVVRNPDAGRLVQRCAVERVTHTVGVTVDGVARLDGD